MDNNYYDVILSELDETLKKLPDKIIEELIRSISDSSRIFITGKGRTGLIMKTFAIRLMQMGFVVHVLGESTTPSIRNNDMLLIGSGSGETESLVLAAEKAKKLGSKTVLISMSEKSSIAKIVDQIVVIPAKGSKFDKNAETDSVQPMCNLFEQCLLIFLDSLGMAIMEKNKIDKKLLYERHANLE
jgi:6-phospho-3-hexuloisomerase